MEARPSRDDAHFMITGNACVKPSQEVIALPRLQRYSPTVTASCLPSNSRTMRSIGHTEQIPYTGV